MDSSEHHITLLATPDYGTLQSSQQSQSAQASQNAGQRYSSRTPYTNVDSSCDYEDPLDEEYPSCPDMAIDDVSPSRTSFSRLKESVYFDFCGSAKATNEARDAEEGLAVSVTDAVDGRKDWGEKDVVKNREPPVVVWVVYLILAVVLGYFVVTGDPGKLVSDPYPTA